MERADLIVTQAKFRVLTDMKRKVKVVVWIVAGICSVALFAYALLVGFFLWGTRTKEKVYESAVTPVFGHSIMSQWLPITVTRLVTASSFGGLHGDGQEVSAYSIQKNECEALIMTLKEKNPTFAWGQMGAYSIRRDSPWSLLPKAMLPDADNVILFYGRSHPPPQGPRYEVLIDTNKGTLYWVYNQF